MTIASVGTLGTGAHSTSATSFTLTTSAQVEQNNVALLVVSTDNTSTSDGFTSDHTSVTDPSGTGSWDKLGEYTNGNAAAEAGVTVSVWMKRPTGNMASGTVITMNLGTARVDKCASAWEFTVGVALTKVTDDGNATDASNGFGSSSISGLASAHRLYFRGLAKEANSTTQITPSGSFSAITAIRSRNNAAAVLCRGEFRINTSTGETSNPTLAVSGDTAGYFVALVEQASPIAGTSSPTFTGAGTLTGKGALAGTSSPSFTGSGTLTEAGGGNDAIAGTSSAAFTGSATLTGKGALVGTSTPAFTLAGALTGKGVLAGSSAPAFTGSATLRGKGALAGSSAPAFTGSAVLTGDGALAGAVALAFATTGVLTPPGQIVGASSVAFSVTGTLRGKGALVGLAQVAFAPAGSMRGIASISGAANVAFAPSATLRGRAPIAGLVSVAFTSVGDLTEFVPAQPGELSVLDKGAGLSVGGASAGSALTDGRTSTLTVSDTQP